MTVDPVHKLEHDHIHLNRVVGAIRDSIQACLRGEIDRDSLKTEFDEFLDLLRDELYHHFDLEEQSLFPYIVEHVSTVAPMVADLEEAHDRMCGIASRIEWLIANDEQAFGVSFDTLIALFARFDANYVKHARDEHELLRNIGAHLTLEQRREISELMRHV